MIARTIRQRVLVVEDEPSVADALKIVLSDNCYEVAVALTGQEGLDKATRQKFDVTITDLRLPDMSGLEVITTMRERYPNTLVIVITAHYTPEVAAESIRRGAVAVLAKPFNPSDILNLLHRALSEKGPHTR